ncbi:hypothetical protein GTO91_08730 [Heliobacterium undosum]|uniref:Uncharacterized protein n=1 Tax=Heliomicrobium undosum TaxID=121734 RepID=A0A845L3S1_9FIRM|nr:hypothetical protein [Heliomicrobium undosum]MZP29789.1 hypothetical protein [Heliomicrobium undosum]
MIGSWKKALVATSVAGALLCGGVIAYAATDTTTTSDNSKPSFFQKFGKERRGGFKGQDFARGFQGVAAIIGIDEAALKTELQSGKTLAEIAQAKGIAKEDLIAKMVAAAQARLDEAVAGGRLSAEEAAQKKETMKQQIEAAVDKKHTDKFVDRADKKFGDMAKDKAGFPGPAGQEVADLLKMTQDELKTELKAGKSLAEIAQAKGVAKEDLVAKMVAAAQARLDEAVSNGKITAEKAAQMKEAMKKRIEASVDKKPGDKAGFRAPGGFAGSNHFQVAADLLQMTKDELTTELKAGKSLEEVAQAKGVAKETLKAKLIESSKADIDKAVADGKLTAEKAEQAKTNLEKRVDDMLSRKGFGGRPGMK